jgi:DNA-binding Lrp family transcriptional regulator
MVDEIDRSIISYLSKNARIPFLQIAKQLEISEASVRHRVKNLQENEVIKGFSANVDPAKLGYGCVAYVGVDINAEQSRS